MLNDLLERTRLDLHSLVGHMDEAACRTKMEAGAWSVSEIVEHLITVENRVAGLLGQALAKGEGTNPVLKPDHDDQFVLDSVSSRTTKVEAPPGTAPTGRYISCQTALQDFDTTRDQTLALAGNTEAKLRSVQWPHPMIGTLDGYQWLLAIAGHTRRHIGQIQEGL